MSGVTGTNAFLAMNTNNDFILENMNLTFTGAGWSANSIFNPNLDPVQGIDINRNIEGIYIGDGGIIRNFTVTQTGTVPPNNEIIRAVTISPHNAGMRVYHATINLPSYVSGAVISKGAVGLSSDADDTIIEHITCHGATYPQWPGGGPSSYANVNLTGGTSTYRCLNVDSVKGGTELPCGRAFALHCV